MSEGVRLMALAPTSDEVFKLVRCIRASDSEAAGVLMIMDILRNVAEQARGELVAGMGDRLEVLDN